MSLKNNPWIVSVTFGKDDFKKKEEKEDVKQEKFY